MKIYVSEKENIDLSKKCYLTFSMKDKQTVDWNVLAQSLEQHDKELLKEFATILIDRWCKNVDVDYDHEFELHYELEELLKERGVLNE